MRIDGKPVENNRRSRGAGAHQRNLAFFLAMLMVSLSGVPPLAGFFAKFYVFLAAIQADLFGLAVIGVLLSTVAAFYYLRLMKVMYFDEPAAAFDQPSMTLRAVLAVSTLSMLLYWVYPAPLVQAAESAAQSLF